MATKKSTAAKINPKTRETPVQVLKEGTCPTSSGKSNLGYQIGVDDTGTILLRVSSNDGGGFFSNEWIAFADIQAAIEAWPDDQGITSMTFRKIYRGKSSNTPGFLIAVLCAEGLLEQMPKKQRVHQACDPSDFLASVGELCKEAGITSGKKPAAKAKAKPKAKAKANAKAAPKAKAKTPRKTATASRKGK
jgi:hypothetical protein